MARCDVESAKLADASCAEFFLRQERVANQIQALCERLRHLGNFVLARSSPDSDSKVAIARFERYMGHGTAQDQHKIALVHNVLRNAETQLREPAALTRFTKSQQYDGAAQPGFMVVSNRLDENTILHEAIHSGTAVWRSRGGVLPVLVGGTIGQIQGYGGLKAAQERAAAGWSYASKSAASYAWLVTGP